MQIVVWLAKFGPSKSSYQFVHVTRSFANNSSRTIKSISLNFPTDDFVSCTLIAGLLLLLWIRKFLGLLSTIGDLRNVDSTHWEPNVSCLSLRTFYWWNALRILIRQKKKKQEVRLRKQTFSSTRLSYQLHIHWSNTFDCPVIRCAIAKLLYLKIEA